MVTETRSKWLTVGVAFVGGLAIGLLAGHWLQRPFLSPIANPQTISGPRPTAPWGQIDALRIPFANSDYIFADKSVRLQPPRWVFEGFSRADLTRLFGSCGLDDSHRAKLIDQQRWQSISNGIVLCPPPDLVRDLPPGPRQSIYAVLARYSSNYPQQYPFRFTFDDFDARFEASGLLPDKIRLIQSLAYTNSGTLCLADIELLPDLLKSNEFDRAVEALYRLPAYRLRLVVRQDSDIDALVRYWGAGGREKRIRPLLESLAKLLRTNGTSISIGYLLPEFARARLNTFPEAWNTPGAGKEDCFWTALNFFNDQPDDRYLDPANVRKALQTDYEILNGQPRFGDLVTVLNPSGDALHICVFLAEEFVYTKNGSNPLQPWIIMKLPEMLLNFPAETRPRLVTFRRKPAAPD